MKKPLFLILLSFFLIPLHGQIAVESFRLLEIDLTANTHGTMETDQNNEVAALIKVVTTQQGFTFDNGMLGIVKVVPKPGEYWVYVPRKTQKITISHPDLGILRDYYFQIPIESGRTYELKLSTTQITTIIKKKDSSMSDFTIPVASLTLTCPDDEADIVLNGEVKGRSRWTGNVPPGKYMVEAKRPNYGTTSELIEVGDREELEVSVAAPTPLYGRLRVESVPEGATVYVDGERCGITPCYVENLTQLLIGEHKVRIEKQTYDTYTTTVTLEQDKETVLSDILLTQSFYGIIDSRPPAHLYMDGKGVGRTPYSDTLKTGDYRLRLERKKYEPFEETITLSPSNPYFLFKLRQIGFPKNQFYIGAEAGISGMFAACAIVGAYVQGVNVELRFRFPVGKVKSAYYNLPLTDGRADDPYRMDIQSDYGFEGLVGYGIPLSNQFRLTPSVGMRYTPLTGTSTDKTLETQKSHVVSAVGSLKAEFAFTPVISLVLVPAYVVPLKKDSFVNSFETHCSGLKALYGGFTMNIGIHINF